MLFLSFFLLRHKQYEFEVVKDVTKLVLKNKTGIDIRDIRCFNKSKDKDYNDSLVKRIVDNLKKITKSHKLILCIDELDRCRPDFSLNTIEVIKHFFDIPNIKITFVMNKQIIENQIKHVYGLSDSDSKIYLDKFIKFTYDLPINFNENKIGEARHTLYTYLQALLNKNEYLKLNDIAKVTPLMKARKMVSINLF